MSKAKKLFKSISMILIILLTLIIIILLYSFLNHKIKTNQELTYLKKYDLGQTIEIDSQKVNYKIFNESNNQNTIILMGGLGTTDLALSFVPLAKTINAKIILINRPGYGLSEDTNTKANVEYILNFYRSALKQLNITDRVILMPHSISGMYAMYWAEKFPNEIKSIIGLDIGSPFLYLESSPSTFSNNISYLGSKLGLHRFIYKQESSNTAIKNYNVYQDNYFQAIWYMNMINPYSKFNLSEENLINKNAKTVSDNINDNYHNIPKLYIIANSFKGKFYEQYEKENLTKYYKDEKSIKQYISNITEYQRKEIESLNLDNNTTFKEVEGPHAIYYYPTAELSQLINSFLSNN